MFTIDCVEMGRYVVIVKYANDNSIESGDDWHLFFPLARIAAHAILDVVVDDEVQLPVREAVVPRQHTIDLVKTAADSGRVDHQPDQACSQQRFARFLNS